MVDVRLSLDMESPGDIAEALSILFPSGFAIRGCTIASADVLRVKVEGDPEPDPRPFPRIYQPADDDDAPQGHDCPSDALRIDVGGIELEEVVEAV